MKISKHYTLREIAGEAILVHHRNSDVDMTRAISLNSSARMLFIALEGRSFTLDDVANRLVETYGISKEVASKDAGIWVNSLKKHGIIE